MQCAPRSTLSPSPLRCSAGLQARSRGEFPNGRTATAGSALVMETAAITGSGSGGGAKPKGKGKAKKAVSKKLQKMQLDDDSGAGGAGAGEAKVRWHSL